MKQILKGLTVLLVFVAAAVGSLARTSAQGPHLGRSDTHGLPALQEDSRGVEIALTALLARQAEAWNRGDIDGFMQGYWRSPQTTFSGASGVLRGWQIVLEHYQRDYPNVAAMGKLTFTGLEITPLGNDAALILGKWHLDRESGPVGGVFTLVARKLPEGWRIVHDHTSTVATALKPSE